jgi:YggT family protein
MARKDSIRVRCLRAQRSFASDQKKEEDGMFVLGNFFSAVALVLHYALWLYMWIIIARAVISWVSPDPYNPIVQFLYRATEPVLEPIRRKLPGGGFGIDLSPLIAILAIYFLDHFLVGSLQGIAGRLR